jgi:hypothetical protein
MKNEIAREELHHRTVDLRFFRRSDGLYEVEGHLIDTKQHALRLLLAAHDTPPGTPIHDIRVRLVLDADLMVRAAEAHMPATPFAICPGATGTLQPLVGLRIGAGWNKRLRELLGGAASCSHITELLGPMATTALQGIAPQRLATINDPAQEAQRHAKVDSCYAYAAEREVVARLWPHLHRLPVTQDFAVDHPQDVP